MYREGNHYFLLIIYDTRVITRVVYLGKPSRPATHQEPVYFPERCGTVTKLELAEAFNITKRTPRRVAAKYIVMPLSQEEIDGCREAFNKFDKDGSGTVRDPELLFLVSLAMARTNT